MTTWAWALFGVGVVLEFGGLLIALVGFRTTWRDYATGDERFLEPVIQWATRAGRRARSLFPWWRRPHVVSAPAAMAAAAAFSGRIRVDHGPLPSIVDDPKAFADVVERRIGDLHGKTQDLDNKLADEVKARDAADREARSGLEARIAEVDGMSRSIAVGGLREQAAGWLCITTGFASQVIATFLQAAAGG